MTINFSDGAHTSSIPPFNLRWEKLRTDPYPIYAYYRKHDPVHWGKTTWAHKSGGWHVFRWRDIHAMLSDDRFGSEPLRDHLRLPYVRPPEPYRPFLEMIRKWILFREPPYHTKIKAAIQGRFKSIEVARMRDVFERQASILVDQMLQKARHNKPIDLISDFANPFPTMGILELMGVTIDDIETIRRWTSHFESGIDGRRSNQAAVEAGETVQEITQFFNEAISKQGQADGLVSWMVGHKESIYSHEEMIATLSLLLFAGQETIRNLIGNGMLALLETPAALEDLKSNPELIQAAVAELLRFNSPVQATERVAYRDVELGGRVIRRGQAVLLHLGSANRDPEIFQQPNDLDFSRTENRHMGFGKGIHYCLGSHLALLEGEIGFRILLSRLPNMRLTSEKPIWGESIAFHGLKSLPISV